ncbi:MAG: DUF368 domain-containing protein [Acidimicrobiia bacterium]|nr:DUF368 domain-containing protein [Acidimicrobiia bacterium]
MKAVVNVLRGFLMGAADLVPGVSGGTVALVLGIYRRLISSVRSGAHVLGALVRFDLDKAKSAWQEIDWPFILTLVAGIGLAILTLSSLIRYLRVNYPVETAAVFFGLVAASIVVAWRLVANRDTVRISIIVGVAVVAFLVLGLRSGPVGDPAAWMFFAAGAVAICAMILPGISGAFILLMLGMYDATIDAIHERNMVIVVVFAVGATIGLALFAPLLDRLLNRYHDSVIASLIGLMAGSLRVLWPWPDGTETTSLALPSGQWLLPIVLAVVGAGVVLVVAYRVNRPASVVVDTH